MLILLELFSKGSNYIPHSLHQVSSINNRIIKLRCISARSCWSHISNTVVLIILAFRHAFRHNQCLHLMYAEVIWVIVSSGTQNQLQIILETTFQIMFSFLMTMMVGSSFLFKVLGFKFYIKKCEESRKIH